MYNNLFLWAAKYNHRDVFLDVLSEKSITLSSVDKIEAALSGKLLTAGQKRLFAVWCARQVEYRLTDKRSLNAIDVAERFAHGKATHRDLDVAYTAAVAAINDAVCAVASPYYARSRIIVDAASAAADTTNHEATRAAHQAASNSVYAVCGVTNRHAITLSQIKDTRAEQWKYLVETYLKPKGACATCLS